MLSDVFWDPVDQTTLAAEQVDHQTGKAWRSGKQIPRYNLLLIFLGFIRTLQSFIRCAGSKTETKAMGY